MRRRLIAALCVGTLASTAQAGVSVAELPSPMAGQRCNAPVGTAINESGAIIANCRVDNVSYSFVWSPLAATWTPITVGSSGSSTRALYLNNVGQVAGFICSAGCQTFLWTPGQPTYVSGTGTGPSGLNDLGDMVLSSPYRLRYRDGTEAALPAGWQPAFVNALNNLGQVAVRNTATNEWGTWASASGVSLLPALPAGLPVGALLYALNDTGRFLGASAGDASTQRTIFYAPTIGYQLLPPYRFLYHVNALGHLAGESLVDATNGVFAATYARTPDEIIDLGLYGGERTVAVASNSSNQVVGSSGGGRILLWTVSPPPPAPPAQQIAAVVASLTSLVNEGTLSRQDVAGLLSKLDAATIALAKTDKPAATSLLQATVNQLSALENSRRLSATASLALRTAINSIIAAV